MHTERLDTMLPQDQLLSSVNIPQTNVNQLLQRNQILLPQPPKNILSLLLRQSRQKSNRHPMHIPTLTRLGRINIRMRIHPNNRYLSIQSLPYRLRGPRNCPNRNTMITSKSQDASAFFRMRVDLIAEFVGDGRDGEGVLHSAEIGVGGREKLFVGVDGVIVEELVA